MAYFFMPLFRKGCDYMWCEVQKNGTVKYCERYTDPLTEKVKKVTVTMPKASPQNRNKAARILNAKIDVALQYKENDKKITLSELQEMYLNNQEMKLKKSTTDRNRRITTSMIELLGEDVIVNNLTAQYMNEALLSSGKPVSTINAYHTRFRAMLNLGYQNDWHDNYRLISKIKLFDDKDKSEDTSDKYLEPDEVNKLLDYMKVHKVWNWYYATSILLLTGLRVGELIALRDDDIDLDNNVIHVTKTYDYHHDLVTSPKTDDSARDIHIQPELSAALRKCRLWRREMLLERGLSSVLLIPDMHTGYYMSYGAYSKFIREITERELQHRISPHKLRHTHASLLAAAGMTPDQIARRLGHSKSDITQDIYIHVTKQVIDQDNRKMDSISLIS